MKPIKYMSEAFMLRFKFFYILTENAIICINIQFLI